MIAQDCGRSVARQPEAFPIPKALKVLCFLLIDHVLFIEMVFKHLGPERAVKSEQSHDERNEKTNKDLSNQVYQTNVGCSL